MSWDEQEGLELEPDAEAAGAEAPDPNAFLEALDDDQREQVTALIAAREREVEQRFRKSAGKWGNATNLLNEHLGVTVDDSGRPAIADPERLRAFAAQLAGQQQAQTTAEPAAEEEEWNPFDPAQVDKRAETLIERQIKAALAPFLETLQMQQSYLGAQTFDPALGHAKAYLDRHQMGEITDTPEFQSAFKLAVDQMPLNQRADPKQLARVAMMVLPDADAALEAAGRQWRAAPNPQAAQQRVQQVRQTLGTATRNGLAAATNPRGLAATQAQELSDFDRAGMELAGFDDPEEWLASQSNEGYHAWQAKKQAQAARNRR